jgi:hypothetical protein
MTMTQAPEFTMQDPWRVFRIMSEFVEGFETMGDVGPAVSIFGSARTPKGDPFYAQARRLAKILASRGFAVVTGGGPGIMEAANRGAKDGGGLSIGLNIALPKEQEANPYTDRLINFHYFFARLVMFVKYACAFVCFPGGFGTLHEFFNSMTLIQTGKAEAFPVILIGRRFWKGLDSWMRLRMLEAPGKISPGDMSLFRITDDLAEAVAIIEDSRRDRAIPAGPTRAVSPDSPSGEGTRMGQAPRVPKRRK